MPKREGPFEIIDKKSPLVFKLRLPPQWKIHNTFHTSLLVPHTENFLNRFYYLVKWEGYPTSENTWEPPENLEKATDILRQYKRLHRLP
ncbi:Histone-lysine N-methyltransferase SUV39H1 [Leucoagaricus sp. SymC.cos]|nr:Histone-lysine N-methyltransferase SUV39H1 [Leucoagaricus sp. SymC.cos]